MKRIVLGAVLGVVLAGGISCSTAKSTADGGGLQDVRVQSYNDGSRNCLAFTHDTGQGASIAVSCA